MPTASRRFSLRFAGGLRCCASQDERQRSLAKQRVTGGNVAAGFEPSLGSPSFLSRTWWMGACIQRDEGQ